MDKLASEMHAAQQIFSTTFNHVQLLLPTSFSSFVTSQYHNIWLIFDALFVEPWGSTVRGLTLIPQMLMLWPLAGVTHVGAYHWPSDGNFHCLADQERPRKQTPSTLASTLRFCQYRVAWTEVDSTPFIISAPALQDWLQCPQLQCSWDFSSHFDGDFHLGFIQTRHLCTTVKVAIPEWQNSSVRG